MSQTVKRNLLEVLKQHFVSLNWVDETEANKGIHHRSAFVTEVGSSWLLVTAGHVIEDLEKAIDGGYDLPTVTLADCYGDGAMTRQAMLFDYINASKAFAHDEVSGRDFGIIELRKYYRLNIMKHGGAVPLGSDAWLVDPNQEADGYYLVGVAKESVVPHNGATGGGPTPMRVQVVGYPVKRVEPASSDLKRDREMFYGRLVDDPSKPLALESIKGMSGSPIFGVKHGEGGSLRYWLVGLQSYWCKTTREIRGSLTAPVLARLEEIAEEFLAKNEAEAAPAEAERPSTSDTYSL